jgi:hypothetical protein
MLVAALSWVLPDFDYTWLVDSTKASLPQACPVHSTEHEYRCFSGHIARRASTLSTRMALQRQPSFQCTH